MTLCFTSTDWGNPLTNSSFLHDAIFISVQHLVCARRQEDETRVLWLTFLMTRGRKNVYSLWNLSWFILSILDLFFPDDFFDNEKKLYINSEFISTVKYVARPIRQIWSFVSLCLHNFFSPHYLYISYTCLIIAWFFRSAVNQIAIHFCYFRY